MNKKILSLIVIIAAVAATFAWSKQIHKSNPQVLGIQKTQSKLRLGVNTWVGYGPFWLAQDKGFFKDEGMEVEISVIEDSAQRKAAVLNKNIDALGDTVDLLVLARDQKIPSVAVMQIDISNGADGILAGPGINTIEDLKGKKIAVQKNFVSESMLYYLLKEHGMSPKDVQVIDTEAGAAGAAFVAGQVDVAVTFEPWMSKAKERSGGKLLASSKDANSAIADILTVHEDYLKDNPDAVKKFLRAWFKALDYYKQNPKEASELMGKHYNVSGPEFSELLNGVVWNDYKENAAYFGNEKSPGKIFNISQTFGQIFLETGQIKSIPNMNGAIDGKLINSLYE